VSELLPERYSEDKALLAGYIKQCDILVGQSADTDVAVSEIAMQPWGLSAIAHNKHHSRGTIMLNTNHPEAYPIVRWNAFQNPVDADAMIALTLYNRKHWASEALAKYKPVETAPEIIQGGMESASLQPEFAHPSGGCSMMPEELGGSGSDKLLVRGVEKLSVIDASIIPLIPATHLQATMYTVAKKSADIIKANACKGASFEVLARTYFGGLDPYYLDSESTIVLCAESAKLVRKRLCRNGSHHCMVRASSLGDVAADAQKHIEQSVLSSR
jgi:hypothetical protein